MADQQTRSAFAAIMSIGFEIPQSICDAVYASEYGWGGDLRGYVGYMDSRPVTTAAMTMTGDVVGLYSIATLPQYRRLGFAEAIMWQIVKAARESAGATRTVLQSTRSGLDCIRRWVIAS